MRREERRREVERRRRREEMHGRIFRLRGHQPSDMCDVPRALSVTIGYHQLLSASPARPPAEQYARCSTSSFSYDRLPSLTISFTCEATSRAICAMFHEIICTSDAARSSFVTCSTIQLLPVTIGYYRLLSVTLSCTSETARASLVTCSIIKLLSVTISYSQLLSFATIIFRLLLLLLLRLLLPSPGDRN